MSHQGAKPKVKEDDFEDLVQGFASRPDKKGPRTIAEMRREEMTKDTDPLKLKVKKKKKHLRFGHVSNSNAKSGQQACNVYD